MAPAAVFNPTEVQIALPLPFTQRDFARITPLSSATSQFDSSILTFGNSSGSPVKSASVHLASCASTTTPSAAILSPDSNAKRSPTTRSSLSKLIKSQLF